MKKARSDFSFGKMAPAFGKHIEASIPGYRSQLVPDCVRQSVRFVQPGTNVYDVGCSTGHLLARVRRAINETRPGVKYIGIDREPDFGMYWNRLARHNLSFEVRNALGYDFEEASLIYSLFTLQFVPPKDKLDLIRRMFDGLVEGAALIIAEKTLAETARLQEAMHSGYYEYKRSRFTADEILEKERSLRGFMTLWTEAELRAALNESGFREMSPIWRASSFVAYLALK
jgi:tRNA (cmo5U34)-methyltransferase